MTAEGQPSSSPYRSPRRGDKRRIRVLTRKEYQDPMMDCNMDSAASTPPQDALKAQHHEDEILSRHFAGVRAGVFLEVGAFDGVNNSNTWYFEQAGWSGVLVEPNPDLAEMCRRARPKSRVFECAAVGDRTQRTIRLDRAEGNLELSSISMNAHRRRWLRFQRVSAEISTIEVAAKTIDDILQEAGIEKLDFATIDVEGFEFEALRGFTLSRFDPEIVIIERNTIMIDKRILDYLNSNGYEYFRTTGSNDWFRRYAGPHPVPQGLLLRVGSIRTSEPLRQRIVVFIGIFLSRMGLLSTALSLRDWLRAFKKRKSPRDPAGWSLRAWLVRATHYVSALRREVLARLVSCLGKRPCKAILTPALARARRGSVGDGGRLLVTYYGLGLGDTIAFLPVLRALLSADLDPAPLVLMPSRSHPLVDRLCGDTSRIVFYDASRSWRHAWRFFRGLKEQGISTVLDFTVDSQQYQREALCHVFTANRVVGFLDRDGVRSYYDSTVRVDKREYVARSFAQFLELHTGIKVDSAYWDDFPLSPREQENVRRFLVHNEIVGKRMIAVFPTTGKFKRGIDLRAWPYFGSLIERLGGSSGSAEQAVVLFGDASHRRYIESLVPASGAQRVVCACSLSVNEVGAIIRQGACVVTTNSGFLHIACNLRVPTVTFPMGESCRWIPDNGYAHQVFCTECEGRRVCTAGRPLQRNCYRNISVERALQRIREVQRDVTVSVGAPAEINERAA